VFLSVVVSDEHDRVRQDSSRYASREAFPEAKHSSFIAIYIKAALNHSSIGYKWMILVELKRDLAYL
jgi:hypothetical protein